MRCFLVFGAIGVGALGSVLLGGCVADYEDANTRLVGVGYNPEEIGPSPTPYGGVVEYSWVNFAGAGLSAAMMGLVSYDEVGPGLAGYKPPYAAVFGFSYVFDTRLAAADSMGGVTSVPPDTEDACYTTIEATGPIGSFTTVDVGTGISLLTADGSGGIVLDRYPTDYPPNPQDVFVYYIGLDTWNATPQRAWLPTEGNRFSSADEVVVRRNNFPFGEPVSFSFPGGMPPEVAPVASIPLPSAYAGSTSYALPDRPDGVLVSWDGPAYDPFGRVREEGAVSTCLAYQRATTTPVVAEDCLGAEGLPAGEDPDGNTYTGPWDTSDGQVRFRWVPGARDDEYVSLAVRFLRPVDEASPELQERVVEVTPDRAAERAWEDAGGIPGDVDVPVGERAPMPCEDAGDWRFDDAWRTAEGDLVPAMQGDPTSNLAEVTCRLRDDGDFVLTSDILTEALTYARRQGSQGAVFYFARSTDAEAAVPPARNRYQQRLDITPVKLTSRAIHIGRFYLGEDE